VVKYNGKEITQDEFDKIMEDAKSVRTLADGYEKKVKDLEVKNIDLDKLGDLQSQLKAREDELFKIKLNSRISKISKYLETKQNNAELIKRIGGMDDELFSEYIDGKTNDELKSNEEIESAKTELEKKEKDLIDNRDKIIKEAQKSLNADNKNKDQKLVPAGEVNPSEAQNNDANMFPDLKSLKTLYNLENSSIYDRTPTMESKAASYLKQLVNQAE
jgi:hypothetical protein